MAKERKPDFIYIKSDVLKQEVAISKKTGWLYCEDGVRYSPSELCAIEAAGSQIDILTHMVKKVIGGEVVKVERPADKRKPDEGKGGNDKPVNTSPHAEIPGAHGNSPPHRDGELDIY